MTALALFAAALLIASIFSGSRKTALWAAGLCLGISVIANGIVPGFVQRFRVEPSELARERPYVARHIELTRRAYGLDGITACSHPARGEVEAGTMVRNRGTVQNIRLCDEGPLLQSYNQIQFFRLYYDFVSVTTDRYMIDGELRQVMLSTRELSAEKLPSEAQRWVNRHLQFTHGYGVAMSPVTEVTAGGRPAFFVADVPPQGKIPLERPEIYDGLKSIPHLIVNTDMQEFNYPGPKGPVYTRYDGNGGVPLSSRLRRFLYAWYFGDVNILISDEIRPKSRIQYRRTVTERVLEIAPFLVPDQNPYTVVADGRLFWIQDAYTVTHRFPYSERWQRRFNYIRNSVKVVVNAYDGAGDFSVADPDDPLIRTDADIFPGVFKPLEDIPEYLNPHLRYPQDLFTVQVQILLKYHMKDPVVFYNKEDQWDLPRQTAFGKATVLLPYYIVARLPGEQREEFILLQPFTPANRHNLVAWIAARSDPPHYGELLLFEFPSGRHVDGPSQIDARIDNDAVISEQFTLSGQVGSEVSRGIFFVIPIGESILYAEPVFLRPVTLDFPELRRIILADSRQVVMHPTLDQAVRALVGELPAVAPAETEGGEPVITERRVPPAAPPPWAGLRELESIKEDVRSVEQRLQNILRRLEEAMQDDREGPEP